ncbi:MAG: hypothetical protein WC292_02190 [Clostridia bacterium]
MERIKKTPSELLDMMHKGESLEFDEFLNLLKSYGELEFYYNSTKFGVLRLNDDYSSGKDKEWDRTKDYYAIFLCFNPNKGVKYRTLEDFAQCANVGNNLLKDIWSEVSDLHELSALHFHGYSGTHDHQWFGEERGPAVAPNYKDYH